MAIVMHMDHDHPLHHRIIIIIASYPLSSSIIIASQWSQHARHTHMRTTQSHSWVVVAWAVPADRGGGRHPAPRVWWACKILSLPSPRLPNSQNPAEPTENWLRTEPPPVYQIPQTQQKIGSELSLHKKPPQIRSNKFPFSIISREKNSKPLLSAV
jgi:hypothetical protein